MLIPHNLLVGMTIQSKVLISSHCQELLILLWSAAAWRILHEEPQSYFIEKIASVCPSESYGLATGSLFAHIWDWLAHHSERMATMTNLIGLISAGLS